VATSPFSSRLAFSEDVAARLPSERRLLTLVVFEVLGAEKLAVELASEEQAQIGAAIGRALCAPIRAAGGCVETAGPGAFRAVFGVPIAREDDAKQALRAAWDAVAGFAVLASDVAKDTGIELAVRSGVHAATLTIASSGTEAGLSAQADCGEVDRVWLICQAGTPGDVVASADCYRMARREFRFRGLRARSEDLGQVFRLIGVRSEDGFISLLDGPLVGRAASLGSLRDAFAAARDGVFRLVCVRGEAGSGKGRLIREGAMDWERDGGRAIFLKGARGLDETHLSGLARALCGGELTESAMATAVAGTGAQDRAEAIQAMLAYFGATGEARPARTDDPALLQRRAFRALNRLLMRACASGPLLLTVRLESDDEVFRDWLAAFFETRQAAERELPLIIVVDYRPDEADPVDVNAGDPAVVSIDLARDPLTSDDAAQLAAFHLGLEGTPEGWPPGLRDLAREVGSLGAGNPFHIEELARALLARGAIARNADGSIVLAGSANEVELPPSLAGAVGARLDALPYDLRRALQVASTLGREFGRDLFGAVTQDPQGPEWLSRLEALGFLTEGGKGGLAFRQPLVREVAYQTLTDARRRDLHRQAAMALADLAGGADAVSPEILAEHLERSGQLEAATARHFAAGEQARRVYALRSARKAYQAGLRCINAKRTPADLPFRLAGLIALGQVEIDLAAYDAAFETWTEVLSRGDCAQQILALRHLGLVEERRSRFSAARSYLERGLAQARATGMVAEEGPILGVMGALAYRKGRFIEALQLAGGALAALGEDGRLQDRAYQYGVQGLAALRLGRFVDAVEPLKNSLRLRKEAGDEEGLTRSHNNLASVYIEAGKLGKAETQLVAALDLARRLANRPLLAMTLSNLGLVRSGRGDRDLAAKHFEEVLRISRAGSDRRSEAIALANLGELHLASGRPAEGRVRLAEAMALCEAIGYQELLAELEALLMEAALAEGDPEAAREHLARATTAAAAGQERDQALVARAEGRWRLHLGDSAGAVAALDDATARFDALVQPFEVVRTLRDLAQAHAAGGRPEVAEVALNRADAILGPLDAPAESAALRAVRDRLKLGAGKR
jgi:adenylate cyclase